jgi:uncharacterized membrane protein HdeD (DUF308 family)
MDTVTGLVELGVGSACLAIGAIAVRARRLAVGVALLVAGLAAAGHASWALWRH